MSRKSLEVNVRGVRRTVYLNKVLGNNRWSAQIYVNDGAFRTSVTGVLSVTRNGVRRFVPSENSVNSALL